MRNTYEQLIKPNSYAIRLTVSIVSLVLVVVGMIAAFSGHYFAAMQAFAWSGICQAVQCQVLSYALADAQRRGDPK